MADLHLRGTLGLDASSGATWTLAKATLNGIAAVVAAGDKVWCDSGQSETDGTAQSLSAGTLASPIWVVGGTPNLVSGTGLTAVSTSPGYSISTTTTASITLNGFLFLDGLSINAGSGSSTANIILGNNTDHQITMRDSLLILGNTSVSSLIQLGTTSSASLPRIVWQNTQVKFGNASQSVRIQSCLFDWRGGGIASGSSAATTLLSPSAGRGAVVKLSSLDLSLLASTFNFMNSANAVGDLTVVGCTLPASWSGALLAGTVGSGIRARLHNCDTANNGYIRFIEQDTFGISTQETATVISGHGDDLSDWSEKIVTTGNAQYPLFGFVGVARSLPNTATSGTKTLSVEITSDSTLTNGQIALRARVMGSTGSPIYTNVTSEVTDVITTPSTLTTSGATWANGKTNKYTLSVSLAPRVVGEILWEVVVFAASTTVYVDSVATLT